MEGDENFFLFCRWTMDASRVLGTLRAHCDRLELELRELDNDIEEAKAMVRAESDDCSHIGTGCVGNVDAWT